MGIEPIEIAFDCPYEDRPGDGEVLPRGLDIVNRIAAMLRAEGVPVSDPDGDLNLKFFSATATYSEMKFWMLAGERGYASQDWLLVVGTPSLFDRILRAKKAASLQRALAGLIVELLPRAVGATNVRLEA